MSYRKGTFGPMVTYSEDDGSFRASCDWCVFRGWSADDKHVCRHPHGPAKPIPDTTNTPDWCEMREDMMQQAMTAQAKRGERR